MNMMLTALSVNRRLIEARKLGSQMRRIGRECGGAAPAELPVVVIGSRANGDFMR